MAEHQLPLLPLILDDVPRELAEALAQEGVPLRSRAAAAAEGRFLLFDSRRTRVPATDPRQVPIDIHRLCGGACRELLAALADCRSAPHRWSIAGLGVTEEIARVDRRAVRRKILGALREEIERAGGIWLSVAPFPFPYRSALNFRIDHDRHDPSDFDEMLRTIAGNEHATSHFVNAAAYLAHEDALARLKGLDVGSHGFHHHTYRTKEENLRNIRRGIETLRALGIEPSGFAAPHGRFNRGLLAAMEALEIDHSSEFGLAYDDVPLFPCGGNVLQIPVHPVCLGIFLDAVQGEGPRRASATQQAVRAAIDHFRQTARAKYHAGEPLFFYGHPDGRLGRYPQVLRAVFDTADEFGALWRTTMSEFAAWWRVRGQLRLTVVVLDGDYLVKAEDWPAGYRVALDYWRGPHVARMPLDQSVQKFSPGALAYENRAARPFVRPVRIDRPEGLRGRIRRWIDWERETPIEDITTGTLRNWAKRALRRLRS